MHSPEFQKEFDAFAAALHGSGVECDQLAMALCAVNAGGWSLPEFLLYLGSLPPAVIVAAAGLCGAWVQGRYGQKVRLKIGDVEAEGRTPRFRPCFSRRPISRTPVPERRTKGDTSG